MVEPKPEDVTLNTLHGDLKDGFADLKQGVQTGFADLNGEVREGFSDLEDNQGIIWLLREANRSQAERLTQLVHLRIREQLSRTNRRFSALPTAPVPSSTATTSCTQTSDPSSPASTA